MGVKVVETGNMRIRILKSKMEHMADGPDFETIGAMEEVLKAMFVLTQAATHVISGSLKASGTMESDFNKYIWTGRIMYGGALHRTAVPGPPNPLVDYAIYEMQRGGSHDFFGGLPAFDPLFERAFNRFFEENT